MVNYIFLFGAISYILPGYLKPFQLFGVAPTAILLFAIQTIVFVAYKLYIWPYMLSPMRHLPGPKGGSLLAGRGRAEIAKSGGVAQLEWAKELEGTSPDFLRWISWFGQEKLTPLSANACRQTFSNDAMVMPGWFRAGAKTLLGDGLVLADGPRHHAMRKILAPCFTPSQIRHLIPAFWEKCQELNWRMREVITNSGETEVEMNVMDWTDRVTFDMIGITSFGADFHGLRDPQQGFYAVYNRNYPQDGFSDPWDVLYNYVLPAFVSHRWLYMLPVKAYQDMLRDRQIIRDQCQSFIDAELARKDFADSMGNHKNLLSVLVHSPDKMSTEDTISNMMTFIAAGYGTNAAALTWAMYNLAVHRSVQTTLRAEIRRVLKSPHTSLTATDMDAMSYLHAIIMESLRLFPSVPGTFREAARGTTIGNLSIPRGTQMVASILSVNRSCDIWGADAAGFRPERWADEERKKGVEHDGSFMSYLVGRKACIGKEYSLRAMKAVIVALVSEFEFAYEGRGDPLENLVAGITMRPKGGMKLKVRSAGEW